MSFTVTITAETGRAYVPFLREQVRAAHGVLERTALSGTPRRARTRVRRRLPLREMSVALVNDARMSELHREFMGIPGPTDVLTFPIDEDRHGHVRSGEVVLCVPQARRQARVHKIPPRLELLLYAIHGMLHLLGYDDRTARDFQTMHATEDEVLTQLGHGPVFAPAREREPARPRSSSLHSTPRPDAGQSTARPARSRVRTSERASAARKREGARRR